MKIALKVNKLIQIRNSNDEIRDNFINSNLLNFNLFRASSFFIKEGLF